MWTDADKQDTDQKGNDRGPSENRRSPEQDGQHQTAQGKPHRRRLIPETQQRVENDSGQTSENIDGVAQNSIGSGFQRPSDDLPQGHENERNQRKQQSQQDNGG